MPPITQASASEPFWSQVLAAPALRTLSKEGTTYTLADVNVERVIYSAKEDTFEITYRWVWQPSMPAGTNVIDSSGFSNDGYGHYSGIPDFSDAGNADQSAAVTLK